jgi:hypothetical protein
MDVAPHWNGSKYAAPFKRQGWKVIKRSWVQGLFPATTAPEHLAVAATQIPNRP